MIIKDIYMETHDDYDKWGSAMGGFFAVACELSHRGADVPTSWGFRPAPTEDCREHDDYLFEPCEQASTADLTHFGNILHRYTHILDSAGESY